MLPYGIYWTIFSDGDFGLRHGRPGMPAEAKKGGMGMRAKNHVFRAAAAWGMACALLLTGCGMNGDGSAQEPGGISSGEAGSDGKGDGGAEEGGQPSDGAIGGSAGDREQNGDEGQDKDSAQGSDKEGNEMTESRLRRPISPEQPMWIVHIDTWNYADPQKIIALIPEDILPYVVFNISLSISWDSETHEWLMVHDGYETAKSWLRTCADEGVWAMIQPASGGQCHFPDYDDSTDYEDTVYAEFYRDYPNFIGFNYCEQFWGFESADFPVTPTERYEHFARLLELGDRYGGYLVVSWCGNQWSPAINPMAMLKRVPAFEEACGKYTQNYILCEKYTQTSYLSDMESLVLGTWLSGYCGQFGVRYDESGWTDAGGEGQEEYRLSTSLAVDFERFALNGMTVVDGPELIWVSDFRELPPSVGEDGYAERGWKTQPEFENVAIDMFRKVLDGTIRIPSREEVVERTRLVIINDVETGSIDEKYSTPATLFEGLYRMEDDGNLRNNHSFYKSTGRYPSIPVAYGLRDELAKSFEIQVYQSDLVPQWPPAEHGWHSVAKKQEVYNELFPQEYTGDCYAGRLENTWVAYNPYKEEKTAEAELPCRYNTCQGMGLTFSRYTSAIINEYADHIEMYLNNYDEKDDALRENIIRIYGSAEEPAFTYKDRGVEQNPSQIVSEWKDGVFTLTIRQNGPLDLWVDCAGNGAASDRETEYQTAEICPPQGPAFYTGPRQYEAEFFDSMSIQEIVKNGCRTGVDGFQGQGYMKFGTKGTAAVRDTVRTAKSGSFVMKLRYSVPSDTEGIELYVNGEKTAVLSLAATESYSDWAILEQEILLDEGDNIIELKASGELADSLYLDNFVLEGDFGDGE